ncbi:MAG: DUF5711 family protein [Lachnospiraceae bacterium]|nr:DUF5711 family protein [Lachnospiraceae bacterium]
MANRTDFKTVQTSQEELEEINEKVRRHRRKSFRNAAIIAAVLAVVIVGVQLWMALRSYTAFEIRQITERKDSVAGKYESFAGNILEYNNDGAVYHTTSNELIWNQSFEMATPELDICEGYLAVYDRGGTFIYIMTAEGLVSRIETSVPINRVCVASQGTVAVLMKEDHVSYVRLYDRKGKELANGKFYEEKGSFPVDIAFSTDGQKLAVNMLDVTKGKVRSSVSFYNFGSVGQNEIDNNVGSYSYDDVFISEIHYIDSDHVVAIGDNGLILFEGAQKPTPKKEVKFEQEVQSVFYNDKYVGITYSNSNKEESWHIKVYDMNGKTVMENDTGIAYDRIEFLENNEICVRDEWNCEIFTIHSIRKFAYSFDKELYKILSGADRQSYTFVMNGEIDEVRLR